MKITGSYGHLSVFIRESRLLGLVGENHRVEGGIELLKSRQVWGQVANFLAVYRLICPLTPCWRNRRPA